MLGASAGLTGVLVFAFFGAVFSFVGAIAFAFGARGISLYTTVCTDDWSSLGFNKAVKKLKLGR